MNAINNSIEILPWDVIISNMNEQGYALVPKLLQQAEADSFRESYNSKDHYRKTVVMERHRFGKGEYKYFRYPLPASIQKLREDLYTHLIPVANNWMKKLGIAIHYPMQLEAFQQRCKKSGQLHPTVLILQYGYGGFNTLHQDLYGEQFFPIQAVLFLDEPGVDYLGGEFVLTQQVPRAQSQAIVLQPKKGDLLLFASNFRPVAGTRGYYRVTVKHGVSKVQQGSRHSLGIIFHDAVS